jgi:hypothetical protein
MPMRCAIALTAAALLSALAGCGGRDRSDLDLAALAKQPGTEVIRRSEGGKKLVEIHRGGVVITQEHGVTIAAVDHSGHGAVLCAWRVTVDALAALEVCQPGAHEELRQDLVEATDAIADFIVANSLTKVTKAELEAYIARRRTETEAQRNAAGKVCSPEFLAESLPKMEAVPHDARQAETADMLSVPRPPVMDPCL